MTANLRDQLQATLSGTYTLEHELGGGGMSKVFVAEEKRLRRKVVVKVLSPELAQGFSVERFEREIQTAAALQHANIVPVLTAGDSEGLPYYTMPFVDGESLRSRLARGPLAITEVVAILRDVARALGYAHDHGVVHRDIKPDNVLVSGGAAVVTDFGIAKAISAARAGGAEATLTQIGTSIGTPAYMAPEQAAGDPDVDHRADLYSFGCMAYELLAGQVPFAGRTPQRMLAAHMGEAPQEIADFRPDAPSSLLNLVMSCLAKEPVRRPQSAQEISRTLDTITSGGGLPAMPPILLGGSAMFRRALAIYAGAFAVVAVVAKAAIVGIGLPDWVFPGALIVMALGLPVILWTAYVQRVARKAVTATPTFTPGGTQSTTRGAIATMALKAAAHVSWYRTAKGGFYAMGTFVAVIAAFMVMRAIGIGPFGSLLAAGRLTAREPLLLTEFAVSSGDSSLGRVVSEAVRAGLKESSVLSLLDPSRVSAALQRMERPQSTRLDLVLARELAVREGIKAIVDGEVTPLGSGFIVVMRLVPADTGSELASFRASADGPSGLINAVDEITRKLRAKAGESLRNVQAARPLAEVTTSSLEALRKYTEAVYTGGRGQWSAAVALAREAIELDSGFALAWRTLSEALVNAGLTGPASDSAITLAYQKRDRLSERERLSVIGDYFGYGPGRDRAKAIEAFERQLALGDLSNTNSLGQLLVSRREFARAESIGMVRIRAEPERLITYGNVASWRLQQGNLAGAESLTTVLNSRTPERTNSPRARAAFAMVRDSIERSITLLDSIRRNARPVPPDVWRTLAALAVLQGRVRESGRLLREASVADSSRGQVASSLVDSIWRIRNETDVLGTSSDLVQQLEALVSSVEFRSHPTVPWRPVVSQPFIELQPYLEAAIAFAALGRADRARAMLERFDSDVRDTTTRRVAEPDRHVALGWIALAERRPDVAVVEFRRGDQAPDGPATVCAACTARNLALAFEAMSADSAIAPLEALLSATWTTGRPYGFEAAIGPSEFRLGELAEAKGDTNKAMQHYRRFVELWKNADPELQPRVTAARDRLRKLGP